MHRNRTWLLDPIELRTQRNRILPIEGGDGSTLSLDFTTGVLDPRLTFTRSTNATFINSSGLVQWAANNMVIRSQDYTNSAWSKLRIDTTSSGLNVANTTIAPDGSNTGLLLKADAAAGSHRVLQSNNTTGSTFLSNNGFTIITLSAFFKANGSNFAALKISNNIESRGVTRTFNLTNGVVSGIEDATWVCTNASATSVGNGWYRCQITASISRVDANDDQFGMWLFVANGADSADRSFTNSSASVWAWGAQAELASSAGGYNATTTATYQAPRFDHDPTTGSPRGLLIEASGNNLATNSVAMWNWGTSGPTRDPDTTIPDIFGVTGSSSITTRVVKASGTGVQYTTLSFGVPQVTVPANASVDVTFSVWIRMNGANQPKCSLGILDTSGTPSFGAVFGTQSPGGQSVSNSSVTMSSYSSAECDYTFGSVTGWVRCSVSRRLNNTTASPINWTTGLVLIYPDRFTSNAATIYVCGGQIELGIGPSSWIPTGASTGSRVADSCVMTGTNFSSWFAGATEGVLYAEVERPRKINSPANDHGVVSTLYTSGTWLGIQVTATNQFPSSVIWPTGGFVSAGGIATRVPLVSKQAVRWFNGASITNFGNGTQGSTTVGTGSVTLGLLTIGANVSSGTTANLDWLNSCVRRVKFWPTALPNATIQALTT